ncbi:MAG TPA: JAB domain-containing protein, partial [Chloroflexota bacterium]|nr:JAB domain-containing protein [Chloroflexota bacterium]
MPTQLPLVVYAPAQNQLPARRRVCELPAEERPLYRLHRAGSSALATTELLALMLGTADAPGLAADLLDAFGSLHQLARANKAQLLKVRGIGEAQAGRLSAMLELSRRLQEPPADERARVTTPADGANLLLPRMRHLLQEELWVILLDTRNRVMNVQAIYKGSLNSSVVRVGEIFRPAIEAPAAAVIIAHNHPSGCVDAS